MRESIGGTMIFWIVLFLFSIFIAFIAFIVKYARVYKIKNSIINTITKSEGAVKHSDIEKALTDMNYQENGKYKICRYFPSELGEFYYVELYANTEFPIVGKWLYVLVRIKGETHLFNISEDNVYLDRSGKAGSNTENDNVWFSGTKDQCFVCVLGDRCQTVDVE